MPKLEYKGIIARPGTYNYKTGPETKTWEELKRAAQRTPELKLTLGHPMTPDGRPRTPTKEDYLGRVALVINEQAQRIDGIFKFHEEEWLKIPEHLREKLENDEAVEISMGFPPTRLVNGEQMDILWDHTAILGQGERPICPLGECGINVRWESDNGEESTMTYEQASSTKDEEPPTEDAPEETPEPEYMTKTDFEQFKEELFKRLEPQPQGTEDVEQSEPEEASQPETTPAPEPSLEPERAFPAGSAETPRLPYLKKDGSVEIPPDIYLGKTKNKE